MDNGCVYVSTEIYTYSGLCCFGEFSIPWVTIIFLQPPPSDPACWAALPLPLQTRLRHTVASLHSLLASLGAKEEIWSVGNLARYILEECISFQICCKYSVSLKYWTDIGHMVRSLGDQLEAWTPARTRRKTASNKVLWWLRLTQNQELADLARWASSWWTEPWTLHLVAREQGTHYWPEPQTFCHDCPSTPLILPLTSQSFLVSQLRELCFLLVLPAHLSSMRTRKERKKSLKLCFSIPRKRPLHCYTEIWQPPPPNRGVMILVPRKLWVGSCWTMTSRTFKEIKMLCWPIFLQFPGKCWNIVHWSLPLCCR